MTFKKRKSLTVFFIMSTNKLQVPLKCSFSSPSRLQSLNQSPFSHYRILRIGVSKAISGFVSEPVRQNFVKRIYLFFLSQSACHSKDHSCLQRNKNQKKVCVSFSRVKQQGYSLCGFLKQQVLDTGMGQAPCSEVLHSFPEPGLLSGQYGKTPLPFQHKQGRNHA